MTEAEWLNDTDLRRIRPFLYDRISERKLRLFGCACCRRIWHLLTDDRSRQAVEVAERYADRLATREELAAAQKTAATVTGDVSQAAVQSAVRNAVTAGWRSASEAARAVGTACARSSKDSGGWYELWRSGHDSEERQQVFLLRDIVSNPFRSLPKLDPIWLAWNDCTIPKLAQVIYDERAFDRLPILADALEEAGCNHADILAHCRSGGEHVRGCWVVDLILGKD